MDVEADKQLGFCPACGEKVYRHLSDPIGSCAKCGHEIDWHDPSTWSRSYLATRPAGRKVGTGLAIAAVLLVFTALFAGPALSLVIAIVAFGLAYMGITTLLRSKER